MRISPVQLLTSAIERIRIDPVNQEVVQPSTDADLFRSLLVYRHCEKGPDYWPVEASVDDGLRDRTYRIRLGLKTHFEDGRSIFPYQFEIVVSGYFAVVDPKPIGERTRPNRCRPSPRPAQRCSQAPRTQGSRGTGS